MSQCIKCLTEVGCSCNLDANLLCTTCSSEIKKEAVITNNIVNNGFKIATKKRNLGYQ